ncbi:hypothetical protein HPB50_016256 [Hyalomma asiaticum]|uniref:Uncharacterized protein n=1 Tax=Hyalomma asiaticum TaxID=266040 RepID=A0ACB7TL58_HYAAI|nr:hypothetical protein HPB50_016256 [Hyalomma asiaticum]
MSRVAPYSACVLSAAHVSSPLSKRSRVFFLVEKERNSLLLTASPCSAPIEWHIFRKPLAPSDYSEESNGGSPQPP